MLQRDGSKRVPCAPPPPQPFGRKRVTVHHAGGNSRRRMVRLADTPGRASEGQGLRLSARDAGNEAVLAWLPERGVRLEALGNELRAGRV